MLRAYEHSAGDLYELYRLQRPGFRSEELLVHLRDLDLTLYESNWNFYGIGPSLGVAGAERECVLRGFRPDPYFLWWRHEARFALRLRACAELRAMFFVAKGIEQNGNFHLKPLTNI